MSTGSIDFADGLEVQGTLYRVVEEYFRAEAAEPRGDLPCAQVGSTGVPYRHARLMLRFRVLRVWMVASPGISKPFRQQAAPETTFCCGHTLLLH